MSYEQLLLALDNTQLSNEEQFSLIREFLINKDNHGNDALDSDALQTLANLALHTKQAGASLIFLQHQTLTDKLYTKTIAQLAINDKDAFAIAANENPLREATLKKLVVHRDIGLATLIFNTDAYQHTINLETLISLHETEYDDRKTCYSRIFELLSQKDFLLNELYSHFNDRNPMRNKFIFANGEYLTEKQLLAILGADIEKQTIFFKKATVHAWANAISLWPEKLLNTLVTTLHKHPDENITSEGIATLLAYTGGQRENPEWFTSQLTLKNLQAIKQDKEHGNRIFHQLKENLKTDIVAAYLDPAKDCLPQANISLIHYLLLYATPEQFIDLITQHQSVIDYLQKDTLDILVTVLYKKMTVEERIALLNDERVTALIPQIHTKDILDIILSKKLGAPDFTALVANKHVAEAITGDGMLKAMLTGEQSNALMQHKILQERWLVSTVFDKRWDSLGIGFCYFTRKTPNHIHKMRQALGPQANISFPLDEKFEVLKRYATQATNQCAGFFFNTRHALVQAFYENVEDLPSMQLPH